jgi:hypothetical protein
MDDILQPIIDAGAVVLYSYRDLRDVAYSMAHKLGVSFWEAVRDYDILGVCQRNDAAWTAQPNVLQMRYEDMVRHPAAAVSAIAKRLGVALHDDQAAEIAERFSLENNRQRTDRLAEELRRSGVDLSDRVNAFRHDPVTLLHWNHLRDGRVQGWRDAAGPAEIAELARRCGDWLKVRGYESDDRWATLSGSTSNPPTDKRAA